MHHRKFLLAQKNQTSWSELVCFICVTSLLALSLFVLTKSVLASERIDPSQGGVSQQKKEEPNGSLAVIDHGEFNKKGRPAGFYRAVLNLEPSVCGPLLAALNKTHKVPLQTKNFSSDILLQNNASVKWTDLKGFLDPAPVSRTVVDLNNDGALDVIYKDARLIGGYYTHGLYWTDSFPEGEKNYTVQRAKEVAGDRIQTGPWRNHDANAIYVLDRWGNKQSVHPPLPKTVKLPRARKYDIVRIGERFYLSLIDAKYLDQPLNLFVFQTSDRRNHSLVCLYASTYIIRSYHPQGEKQGG